MTEFDFIATIIQVSPTLGILYFLWKAGIIKIGKAGDGHEEVPEWARKLNAHYNEETTEKLDTIIQKQDKTNNTLSEMKEYGVKVRKEA